MIFIDWKVIWEEFEEWYLENNEPEWEAQQSKIEELIEKWYLRNIEKYIKQS